MEEAFEPQSPVLISRSRLHRGISLVDHCFDTLFDQAPVMMHCIDEHGRLERVNRMWLHTLGYDSRDVLGRRCVDFLTERSRAWAVAETLPLFWRTGSARSVGYEMVRKDGSVMNVLLDAELDTGEDGIRRSFATLRGNHDLTRWSHSSTMLAALTGLLRVRRAMETLLTLEGSQGNPDPSGPTYPEGPLPGNDLVLDLLEMAREVSTTMLSLGSTLADSARSVEDQEHNLVELAEAVAVFRGKLPWLTATQPASAG